MFDLLIGFSWCYRLFFYVFDGAVILSFFSLDDDNNKNSIMVWWIRYPGGGI